MHAKTVQQVADELRWSLTQYIEAAYHIRNPALLTQRRLLLERPGVIHQAPYLESTRRYATRERFEELEGLSASAVRLYMVLSTSGGKGQVLHDPPYIHQAEAIRHTLVDQKNLVVMTGTGSGKTESFLMPILGRLAQEASNTSGSFSMSSMRAMVLYPMNALVNDQLGRMRNILGDERLASMFKEWSGRPVRFARYTSRTPYAGVRTKKKDEKNLKQIRTFFIDALINERSNDIQLNVPARRLVRSLKARGKWPAKPDLEAWYGSRTRHWQRQGEWIRCVTLADDSELITRDEVQRSAPDLLITNYSMLEYMLMRPIERTIFDQTRKWLSEFPAEKFLVVLDEAHLYHGSAGAEVALLLRRLRDRLDIPWERMQIICSTASFEEPANAASFASRLTGAPPSSFRTVTGDLRYRPDPRPGTVEEARLFAELDMSRFLTADDDGKREVLAPLLAAGNLVSTDMELERALFNLLEAFGPLSLLVNLTMHNALQVSAIGKMIFPSAPAMLADQAVSNLAALAANARTKPDEPSLLPCRVHSFFRGIRGLWVCMDPQCSAIEPELHGVAGKLFSQPRDLCDCNARVLELYTCRYCGAAFGRAYTERPQDPQSTWAEPGMRIVAEMRISEPMAPIDILLEAPKDDHLADAAVYDLVTGHINPRLRSNRVRDVFIPQRSTASAPNNDDDDDGDPDARVDPQSGRFDRCPCCLQRGRVRGASTIQDHETKGDQPFQVLVAKQIQTQPPGPQPATTFAPLRGRKVLVFSDSRQVAARLAPNLQMFSVRDALRPLIAYGWRRLSAIPALASKLRLDDVFAAVLIAAQHLGVRLRPEMQDREVFRVFDDIGRQLQSGAFESDERLAAIVENVRGDDDPPLSLLADIVATLRDPSLGLEALAIASLAERHDRRAEFLQLPHLPGLTETDDDKLDVVRAWIREWRLTGFRIRGGDRWFRTGNNRNVRFSERSGTFRRFVNRLPAAAKRTFTSRWLPILLRDLTISPNTKYTLDGSKLTLQMEGRWARCGTCTSVFRPMRLLPVCPDCQSLSVSPLDVANDDVFLKRKGYYRDGVNAVLAANPQPPMSLVAAEHTAQLNSSQRDEIFSKAEVNELLFQDIELPPEQGEPPRYAIDVLSSTTTMEVGIDIGQLSGVALRNMPPGRANYQQRSGRAGRRANAIASVVAFGGSDTHDEHFFSQPAEMISGPLRDPLLSLENEDIARRHVRAFLLQWYMQDNIPSVPTAENANLFSVLGTVSDFMRSNQPPNRRHLEVWLKENEQFLQDRADKWLPSELPDADRQDILARMVTDCLTAIDEALAHISDRGHTSRDEDAELADNEVQAERDDVVPSRGALRSLLLDTLLYHGVLPRYAFPTDVTTFHVFNRSASSRLRPVFEFAPSQGTAMALTQYAPDKLIWIAGKCYRSGAVYSPMLMERPNRWNERLLYRECAICGFAERLRTDHPSANAGAIDCRACGSIDSVARAMPWFVPVGFAHPADEDPIVSPDEIPETSYATRAKLIMESSPELPWRHLNERVSSVGLRTFLLVSNTGPGRQGYRYCVSCGRIEAATVSPSRFAGAHMEPFPDQNGAQQCRGRFISPSVVLGTDFRTDVALISMRVQSPVLLHPQHSTTHVALRTLCEALSFAASDLLGIEHGEVMAEYRPALTPEGQVGQEAEIFLYDTLPGGAGFSRDVVSRGDELLRFALEKMTACPDPDCVYSCYRCMRNFRNRLDHSMLDRYTGSALAHYLLTGVILPLDKRRLSSSATHLCSDLARLVGTNAVTLNPDWSLSLMDQGVKARVMVTHPLLQTSPSCLDSQGVRVVEVSELLVRRNVSGASTEVLSLLRGN